MYSVRIHTLHHKKAFTQAYLEKNRQFVNVRINGLNNICIPGLPSSQRTRERASSAETTGELNQRLSGVNLGEFGLRAGFFRFFLDFFTEILVS